MGCVCGVCVWCVGVCVCVCVCFFLFCFVLFCFFNYSGDNLFNKLSWKDNQMNFPTHFNLGTSSFLMKVVSLSKCCNVFIIVNKPRYQASCGLCPTTNKALCLVMSIIPIRYVKCKHCPLDLIAKFEMSGCYPRCL